jgi:iron complex outermembrane recepter protein
MNHLAYFLLKNSIICLTLLTALNTNAQSLMEEVVVTAQKREQNLQDVSVSVSAFSGDTIQELGFQNPHDIFSQIPNVSFNDEGTVPQVNVRGVQLFDFGDGNEPPVGFYVDEVYLGTLAGQTVGLFDIERVEVLRGPQGTLFGRNTTGGLMHFVTRKPTDKFEAGGSFQYGSHDQRIAEGFVSGPFSDRIRGRVAFKYQEDDGWQNNVNNGNNFAVTDTLAFRGQLEIDVTDDLSALVKIHTSDKDNTTQGYGLIGLLDPVTLAPCPIADARAGNCVTAVGDTSNLNRDDTKSGETNLRDETEIWGGILKTDVEHW